MISFPQQSTLSLKALWLTHPIHSHQPTHPAHLLIPRPASSSVLPPHPAALSNRRSLSVGSHSSRMKAALEGVSSHIS